MKSLLIALIVLGITSGNCFAENHILQNDILFQSYFDSDGVDGCFLLYDCENNKFSTNDAERSQQEFIPASTFKILNSLIALELGVVKDENEIIKWDGVDRGWDKWNTDHNMRSAIKYSTIWFYQELAREIGTERMQYYVDLVNYGNMNISGDIDSFWLDGDLRISPMGQIAFLRKLYENDLPFSQRTMDVVKKIIVQQKGESFILSAKTGWAQRITPQIGWFVGYLERTGSVYYFANNVQINQKKDSKARQNITNNILSDLGLLQ